jgi:hypothetical protein
MFFFGSKYVDFGLLGCDAMSSCKWLLTFQKNLLPHPSVSSPEMLVTTTRSQTYKIYSFSKANTKIKFWQK